MRAALLAIVFSAGLWTCQSAYAADSPSAAGEIFGKPVSREAFDFTLKTMSIFNASGKEPSTEAERRVEAWKHLIFLHEAERRGIHVDKKDVQAEMTRLLAEKKMVYGSYEALEWIKTTFDESADVFEGRLENLLKVKKLIDGIMNPPPPVIRDEDAEQKFRNQYNSMATEFKNFPTLKEADSFYRDMSPKKWDAGKKSDPKFVTPTGHISLEAVIDLWQVPTADAYRIHAMKPGQISAPAKMYKGFGVFRMLEKKIADPKEYTEKKKQEYRKVLEQVYYYSKTRKVIQDLINEAKLRDYDRDKVIAVETSDGNFEMQLYPDVAPKACENLIGLAEKGYYDGTVFHRVIKGFMIQGGDPTATGRGGESLWGKPFEDEVHDNVQFEKAGILAMANSGPGTNGSQFFITLAPTPHLNKKHTIFGEVINGFDVVRSIGDASTDAQDKPLTERKIISMRLKKWQ